MLITVQRYSASEKIHSFRIDNDGIFKHGRSGGVGYGQIPASDRGPVEVKVGIDPGKIDRHHGRADDGLARPCQPGGRGARPQPAVPPVSLWPGHRERGDSHDGPGTWCPELPGRAPDPQAAGFVIMDMLEDNDWDGDGEPDF